MNTGRVFSQASRKPFGGSGSLSCASSVPTSRNALTDSWPMASATRSGVPKRLASTGIECPVGCSNSSAGPPLRRTRSQISVISRRGSTSRAIRRNAPRCSSAAMNSRRSA